ncbi:unnamed protein product [Amoebophrya sp. A120]|nr:unnamed protein product [Amoebophrya sp. A120]|eukprot:GSA120T00018150001.1
MSDHSSSSFSAFLKNAGQPKVCISHVAFKAVGIVFYLLGSFFMGYVNTFVVVTLAVAFDFWTVKNVTGRLLVGLRWWNDIQEDGSSVWVFEAGQEVTDSPLDDQNNNSTFSTHARPPPPLTLTPKAAADKFIFWNGMYLWVLFWTGATVLNVLTFSFSWLLLSVCGLGFALANLVGFWKCSRDAKQRLFEDLKGPQLMQASMKLAQFVNLSGAVASRGAGGGSGGSSTRASSTASTSSGLPVALDLPPIPPLEVVETKIGKSSVPSSSSSTPSNAV